MKMKKNSYRSKAVAATLIALNFLRKSCTALICPVFPLGIHGPNGDIIYSAIEIYDVLSIFVGGSCDDSTICTGLGPRPYPIVQKIS